MNSTDVSQIVQNGDDVANVSTKDESLLKGKEREERLRLARERVKEERRRKLEELRELIWKQDEVKRKLEEERRRRIEEMKQRDEQHRASVEERRKKLIDEDNERKQAILRKTAERDAKLEQTKLKKSSAPLSARSSALTITQSQSTSFVADSKSYRNLEKVQNEGESMSGTAKKKRLSLSADRVAKLQDSTCDSSMFESQPVKQDEEVDENDQSKKSENGSASPIIKSATKNTGHVHKSRADTPKTVNSATYIKHAQNDSLNPAVTSKVATPEPTRRRPPPRVDGSKSASSTDGHGAATLPKSSAKSPGNSKTSVQSGKTTKKTLPLAPPPPKFSPTLPPKFSPALPKNLTPRTEPKTSKDGKPGRTMASNKRVVRADHNLPIQKLRSDKEKVLPSGVEKDKHRPSIINVDVSPADRVVPKEDEYKQKLAENRRLAREKLEQDAEDARQRAEEKRREEEERIKREEEEERKREEEELRLAEEARKQEEERFRLAVEEADRQRQMEEEKLEAERLEKQAAEKRAQEEADKKEKERQEKMKREEDERLERKKKLEMIMKRVKPEESLPKDAKELKAEDPVESKPADAVSPSAAASNDGVSRFLSPLLRQIMGNKLKGKSTEGLAVAEPDSNNSQNEDANKSGSEADSELKTEGLESSEKSDEEPVSEPEEAVSDNGVLPVTTDLDNDSLKVERTSSKTSLLDGSSVSDIVHSDSTEELIDLTSWDNEVIKTSDNNQNWAVTNKDPLETTGSVSEKSLPDLPRIAFEDNSASNPLNTIPDILL